MMKNLKWMGLLGLWMFTTVGCSPYYKDSETGSYLPRENYFVAAGKQINYTAPQDGTVYFVSNTGTKRVDRGFLIGIWVNEPIRNTCSTRQLKAGETVEVNFLDAEDAAQFGLPEPLKSNSGTIEVYFIPANKPSSSNSAPAAKYSQPS